MVIFILEVCFLIFFVSVRLAIIFFMYHAASLAFTNSEHMKCLGSEKLNFIGVEGATLIPVEDWRGLIFSIFLACLSLSL